MPPSDRQIQDRLGNALFRLTTIERRAGGAESPKAAARLMDDLRKLAAELERSFEDVREVLAECSRLQTAASAAAERAQMLFDLNPVPCLVLEMTGAIVEANEPAVRLLNVSRRHLVGRSFHLYLGNEREVFLKRIQALPATAERDRWTAKLRPRERSSVGATLTAALDPDGRVLMMLQPASEAFDEKWRAPLTDVEADDRTLAGH
jgi:PAS domain-containing protein